MVLFLSWEGELHYKRPWGQTVRFLIVPAVVAVSNMFQWNDQFLFSKYAPRDRDTLSAHPGLHVSVAPSSSFIRCRASISHTTIFPIVPPIHPSAFLFSRHWPDLGPRVKRGIEGERIGANWKEGGNMKRRSWRGKRKGASRGGVGWAGDRNRHQSEAMIWLLLLSSGGRRSAKTWREQKKNGREWKRESLALGCSVIPLLLPLYITFYINCPHTNSNLPNK